MPIPTLNTIDMFGLTGQADMAAERIDDGRSHCSAPVSTKRRSAGFERVAQLWRTPRRQPRSARLSDARGGVGLDYEDFQGSDETELTLRCQCRLLWRLNRWLA